MRTSQELDCRLITTSKNNLSETHISSQMPYSGVSISTDDRQNTSATLLREVSYFFLLNWKLEIRY